MDTNKVLDQLQKEKVINDYEDAIQYHTALQNHIGLIITRNKRDFQKAEIPALTAKEYLRSLDPT